MSEESPKYESISSYGLSLGIVAASYNSKLSDFLVSRVVETIKEAGEPKEIVIERVPGSHEIPCGLKLMLNAKTFDCLIGLGVVIKGDTSHHHLVAQSAGYAMQQLVLEHATPIINGIVVTDDVERAEQRIVGSIDRGKEFATSTLRMAQLYRKWTKTC